MTELGDLRAIALRAAALARDVIMPVYARPFTVEWKADRTPVTIADRRAETIIRAFLERECPGHGILGEEYGETPGDGRHRWLVDPIDGTKSFIHRVPLFGTLIALERDGEPVVGVIACHATGETVSAATGEGTDYNGEPARVSATSTLGEATLTLTGLEDLAPGQAAGLDRLRRDVRLVRTWGDCYGYLLVATGRADIMLDPEMSPWDAAALYPVIREAGGTITTWEGQRGPGTSVVASNGVLHADTLRHLAGSGPAEAPGA